MYKSLSNNLIFCFLKNDPSRQKRKEDDIIAWTWRTFIKDNGSDPEILLRMPMTKVGITVHLIVYKSNNNDNGKTDLIKID